MCENSVISIFDVVVKPLERYENMTLYYLYFFLNLDICKIRSCGLGEYFYLCML